MQDLTDYSSDFIDIIRKGVNARINFIFKDKHDIKSMLINHPHLNKYCEELCREVKNAQHKLKRETFVKDMEGIVNGFTDVFCKRALIAKEVEITGKRFVSAEEKAEKELERYVEER